MLKLLSKSEVETAKARDKAREISEGLKLTKRVDDLRELTAKEEEALEKFRTQSLAEIQTEISLALKKRDEILEKTGELEKKMESMSPDIPLRRKELENLEKSLKEREERLKKDKEESDLLEIDVALAKKEAEDALQRIRTDEETSKLLHRQALEKHNEANTVLQRAEGIERQAIFLKETTERELAQRNIGISKKEAALKEKEAELIEKQRGLEIEKVQVADQRKTLERALERIKKNRL